MSLARMVAGVDSNNELCLMFVPYIENPASHLNGLVCLIIPQQFILPFYLGQAYLIHGRSSSAGPRPHIVDSSLSLDLVHPSPEANQGRTTCIPMNIPVRILPQMLRGLKPRTKPSISDVGHEISSERLLGISVNDKDSNVESSGTLQPS